MSEQYLWDGSGTPDQEVRHLERVMRTLRAPEAPARRVRRPSWRPAAIAAAALLAVVAWQMKLGRPAPATPWRMAGAFVGTGQSIRAGEAGARIDAGGFGQVELAPGTRLRIAESRPGLERLQLQAGRIDATIWAPPRQFVVDTPSARAVDLGCRYTLSVDEHGDGMLDVHTGWVAFQHRDIESFIPAGARCRTTRLTGPGTPYFADAPPALTAALEEYDRAGSRAALGRALDAARPQDGITLWHLLARSPDQDRAAVFDRFSRLVELPESVTREAVLRKDAAALDLCWDALGLDSAAWWREWKRDWRQPD